MKPAIQSKTIWFNALSCLLAVGALLKPELLPVKIDQAFWQWLAFGLTAGNTVLRFMTTTAISSSQGDQ